MCCLFGMLDYKHLLHQRQKNRILQALGCAAEDRGTDASGIAYNSDNRLCIYKRPKAAHKMHFGVPGNVSVIMGHTRMTTQGDEKRNRNNHPFYGSTPDMEFALAHNGVLYNDNILRKQEKLPATKIETDSYIAVQLIEQKRKLNFDSLKYMAESIEGSFTITVLDRNDNLYFVKGDNPMCIYHYPGLGIYLYSSTEDIMKKALKKLPRDLGLYEKVNLSGGDILKIDKFGKQTKGAFEFYDWNFGYHSRSRIYPPYSFSLDEPKSESFKYRQEYIDLLRLNATYCGYTEDIIDEMLDVGYSTDDIEEMLFCGAY